MPPKKRKHRPYKTRAQKILSILSKNRHRWLTCAQIYQLLVNRKAFEKPETHQDLVRGKSGVNKTLQILRQKDEIEYRIVSPSRYQYRAFRADSKFDNKRCEQCGSKNDLDVYKNRKLCRECMIGPEDNSATIEAITSTGASNLGLAK